MKVRWFCFIILVAVFSCSKVTINQGPCQPFLISDAYIYPVRPGSEAWKNLKSLNDMVAACQIPQSKLKSMSTEGLLETLLNYPLVTNYVYFNSPQMGFNRTKEQTNGFLELYNRKNIFEVLSKRYALMSLDCDLNYYPPNSSDLSTPIWSSFNTYEMFLYQDEFLQKLNVIQRQELFNIIYDKHLLKKKLGFNHYGKFYSSALLAKIMVLQNFTPFVEEYNKSEYLQSYIKDLSIFGGYDNVQKIIEDYAKIFR